MKKIIKSEVSRDDEVVIKNFIDGVFILIWSKKNVIVYITHLFVLSLLALRSPSKLIKSKS